jgi:phosphatidylserine/phosphatidylglycerophosphate/cardiolipin synthase-like enzyme
MLHSFQRLGTQHLAALVAALQEGRLVPPFSLSAVSAYVPREEARDLYAALVALEGEGMQARHLAFSLALLLEEKRERQRMEDRLSLVWTGPDGGGAALRDTAVVVDELFRRASRSVLIATYSLDRGEKLKKLFGGLAQKMEAEPALEVRLFVNVARAHQDTTPAGILVRRFALHFRDELWPGRVLPKLYHDPRALEMQGEKRACLHAKCVIVDDLYLFVTSANFSEAAHLRNIEAGVLMEDAGRAKAMRRYFDALVASGDLECIADSGG